MDREARTCIWKDELKEDINTSNFLELLLKYNYVWCQDEEEMKLNLTETDKTLFLRECCESIEYVDEMRASLIIEIIRHMFRKEFFSLKKGAKKADEPIPPWFFQAYKLFQQSSISEAPTITCPPSPTIATTSITPASVPPLKITDASTLATASSLSSTPPFDPVSWDTLLPSWKLPLLDQEKQLVNPSPFSLKDAYGNDRFLRNVKPQYDFPIIYPVCILPCFSLGRFREESDTSYSRNESEFLSGNEIPVNLPSCTHPHISDFSYLSDNSGISNSTNSYRPESRHSQITNQERNSSHPSTSISPIDELTNFTARNYLENVLENSIDDCSRVSFQSSTARTFPDLNSNISFTSSGSGTKVSSLSRGKLKCCTSPVARIKSPTSSDYETKFSSLPRGKSKFCISSTSGNKSSTLLPTRSSVLRLATTSLSSLTTSSTSTFTNTMSFPSFAGATVPPATRDTVPSVSRDNFPSVSRATVPSVSRVSISPSDRGSTLPISLNSISREVNWPHHLVFGSALRASGTFTGEETLLNLNANNTSVEK